jgi:hypothetical protein
VSTARDGEDVEDINPPTRFLIVNLAAIGSRPKRLPPKRITGTTS